MKVKITECSSKLDIKDILQWQMCNKRLRSPNNDFHGRIVNIVHQNPQA